MKKAQREEKGGGWKAKRKRRNMVLMWGGLAILLAVLSLITVWFYYAMREQMFNERQRHLTEMTSEVSQIIDITIQSTYHQTNSVRKLIDQAEIHSEEALLQTLAQTDSLMDVENGVVLAMDSKGKCYSSEGTVGRWENMMDLVSDHAVPVLRDLTIAGEKQTCLVFLRKLPEEKYLEDEGTVVADIAVAIPLSAMQTAFSPAIYDDSCDFYLVSMDGRRLYKRAVSGMEIKDLNVLAKLQECPVVMGGSMDQLVKAVQTHQSLCLEFQDPEGGEDYFVSTVPVSHSNWTVLLVVPAQTLGAYASGGLSLVLGYFSAMAVLFLIIGVWLLVTLITAKKDKVVLKRQEEQNRQLAQAVEEARSANAAKSEFLAHMSHDIRTPINGILGMTSIAIKSWGDEDKIADCLKKIGDSAEHLLTLVNDVLDMSSIESGKLQIAHEHMDVRAVVDNCCSIISGYLISRHLDFQIQFPEPENPSLLGDELHLRQIFINILGNAVKFTPDGGTITFRGQQVEAKEGIAFYRFEIEDTGIGMSPEFLERVFEPFTQESTDARTTYRGTGLGLAITKQFVDKMGGTIQVRSQRGVGSCFTVELSFDIDTAHAPVPVANEKIDLKGMHVLLVEDNELNMEIAQELLEDEGVIVEKAENGQLAVDAFLDAPVGSFDAILMDVMMPVMDGHQATRAIRASDHPEAATIPIIAMTANAYDEDVKAALSAGMDAHVAKPIDLDRLYSVLNYYRKLRAGGGDRASPENPEKN
jgi:signal transduction histidine kinase